MKYININNLDFSGPYVEIFDLLDDCILIVDLDKTIVMVNKATEELDEINRVEAIGKKLNEIYQSDKYKSATMEALESRKEVINKIQSYTTVHGKNIYSISSSYPLVIRKEMVGVITITKDISKFTGLMNILNDNRDTSIKKFKDKPSYDFDDIIGNSPNFKQSLDVAKKVSSTQANVMIYGETGTGKELFAHAIHNNSGLKGKFVPINCAAIPENLLESLLFGTSKGAYTGAINSPGLFQEAHGGSLFLDELNSMDMDLQSKILRAVETGKVRRIGETKEEKFDVRIISAINVPAEEAIKNGNLRRDLYYRIGVVTIVIPPLRERTGDIETYLEYFIEKNDKKYKKTSNYLDPNIIKIFKKYPWPGNVRELEHAIEHIHIMSADTGRLKSDDLPSFILDYLYEDIKEENADNIKYSNEKNFKVGMDLDFFLESAEKDIIKKCLQTNKGNVAQAARCLNLSRQTLAYRIKKLNLD